MVNEDDCELTCDSDNGCECRCSRCFDDSKMDGEQCCCPKCPCEGSGYL